MDFQNLLVVDQRIGMVTSLDADRASNTWHQVKFDVPFAEDKKVVVLPMTQTYNGASTPNLRIQNVTRLGFEIRIDELIGHNVDTSLADGAHASEVVGWVAYGFHPTSDSTSNIPTPGKDYYLIAKNSGKALQVNGGNKDDGANVDQWTKQNVDHHKWQLKDAGDGYFNLIAKHSGKALAVTGGSTADGANVLQWTLQQVDHFKFKLENTGDGYFYLIAKHSGKAVAVTGGSTADGANVLQWTLQQLDHFKWKFEAV
ncbi:MULTISPECIES: RICIN domain-containing protein [Nostoc]|uniref:RICIN domain-containing protein n=2 Tax=Nostoc TaxID=1177 RepID=A0ABR8HZH4_9NOSO|nr:MULTISPECIES: RICIN domain-containing protein [Nostoc]MBD2560829.1 RICIN domain-containing protein [Nostoc linckia FACHB-391]MBD2644761.1 RICIN domain-containing protein [Nostoc foliaceum FACHB-393]